MARRPLPGSTGRLLGYARVSTEDQATDAQTHELRAAGCAAIYQEHGSGASRARPELARLMREIRPGDVVLVVVRLDRLARSVSHLLEVIERLEESGAPTFVRCATPSTLRRPRACFPSKSSARSRNSNAR